MEALKIGILTVSDRAARGEYSDRGGPAIEAYLKRTIASDWQPVAEVVSDDRSDLRTALVTLADTAQCAWIITTGGTGVAPRDHTPEVTLDVCQREVPGLGEQMRQVSIAHVPTAMLSRQTAGVRNSTLILNLPGSPKAIGECLDAVFLVIPHALKLLGWPLLQLHPQASANADVDHE